MCVCACVYMCTQYHADSADGISALAGLEMEKVKAKLGHIIPQLPRYTHTHTHTHTCMLFGRTLGRVTPSPAGARKTPQTQTSKPLPEQTRARARSLIPCRWDVGVCVCVCVCVCVYVCSEEVANKTPEEHQRYINKIVSDAVAKVPKDTVLKVSDTHKHTRTVAPGSVYSPRQHWYTLMCVCVCACVWFLVCVQMQAQVDKACQLFEDAYNKSLAIYKVKVR